MSETTEKMPSEMELAYKKAKKMLEDAEDIKVYSHTDCDGMSAGAILSSTLERLNKDYEIEILSLDKLNDIELENELTIFSDLGSGQNIEKTADSSNNILILDHHPSIRPKNFKSKANNYLEINSMFYGIDGTHNISGGGLSYFLAREFGFKDLSWLGVLSAVGDLQNSYTGKLEGLNKIILKDAVDLKYINVIDDLSIYGRQTREIYRALSYFNDVRLPITNNTNECILLLKDLGINHRSRLCDLNDSEKGKLYSELIKMLSREVPGKYVKYIPRLVGADSYDLLNEEKYTTLRDVSELSSAINACVRNNEEEVGLKILQGNRTDALDEMDIISKDHRRYLAKTISKIEDNHMIKQMDNLQFFNGDGIRTQVVGTITGMILSYGDWRKPIIGFSQVNDENSDYKISLRCSRLLAYDGIHFGNIMREVSQKVGGEGGGHSVACGAYIPETELCNFLNLFNNYLNSK